jgi:hypothetical protein
MMTFRTRSGTGPATLGLAGRLWLVTLVVLLLGCLIAQAGTAAAAPRFPHPRITAAQWQILLDDVKAKPGAKDISRPDVPDVTAIVVPEEFTVYYFTKPGPAHPAVIIQHSEERAGNLRVAYTGYYAGSEPAFAAWFDAFRRRSQDVLKSLQSLE